MLWRILFETLQVSAYFKLKLAVAVAVLDFGLGGDKSDGAFCQSIRDELRGSFYNCGPALIRARAKLWVFNFRRGRILDTTVLQVPAQVWDSALSEILHLLVHLILRHVQITKIVLNSVINLQQIPTHRFQAEMN